MAEKRKMGCGLKLVFIIGIVISIFAIVRGCNFGSSEHSILKQRPAPIEFGLDL